VERRKAEPAGEHEQQHERVDGGDRRARYANRREQSSARDQPERPAPVGEEPEERLHDEEAVAASRSIAESA
jgi:hypothetical protein